MLWLIESTQDQQKLSAVTPGYYAKTIFIVYINDIADSIENSTIKIFANNSRFSL